LEAFSVDIISLPLYVPHVGQTRWGNFGSLHCGHKDNDGGVKKSWALLWFLRVFECLFTGFGI